ncbi:MAG: hypothetical protein KC506_03600, partial [Nanoarchaeota archaeon]|nr:hypothetical protein [Nanoarchaeota archaeon]
MDKAEIAILDRREPWKPTPRVLLSEGERSGKIPLAEKSLVVLLETSWNHFSDFLSGTSGAVNSAFRDTNLEYKCKPYAASLPKPNETPAEFFLRNAIKSRAPKIHLDTLGRAVNEKPMIPEMFPLNYFSCRIHAGEEIKDIEYVDREIEFRDKENKLKGRSYTHAA